MIGDERHRAVVESARRMQLPDGWQTGRVGKPPACVGRYHIWESQGVTKRVLDACEIWAVDMCQRCRLVRMQMRYKWPGAPKVVWAPLDEWAAWWDEICKQATVRAARDKVVQMFRQQGGHAIG